MKRVRNTLLLLIVTTVLFSTTALAEQKIMMKKASADQTALVQLAVANPCNPCAGNPCAMKNPCAGRNPCSGNNPCAGNPCAMKNPCAANPCAGNPCAMKSAGERIDPKLFMRPAGTKMFSAASRATLAKEGADLFSDNSLSTNGISCNSCHATDHLFNSGFAKPFPHKVKMTADWADYSKPVHADEFVQFCMLKPMAAEPLGWDSRTLAALTVYTTDIKQKEFMRKVAANPCYIQSLKSGQSGNPCAMKNPCGGQNPCAAKNPCGGRM